MQVLLKKLEANLNPIAYKNFIISLIAYTDDLTIFVDCNEQLKKAMRIITAFKDHSGLSVNVEKSEILEINIKTTLTEIRTCEQVKITGIYFTLNEERMITANWEYVKKRIEDKIKGWQGRCLTEIGKAVLVKTVIMPIIAFTGSIIKLPDDTEKALTSIIFGFIWGKTDKITRALAHQERGRGGLGIPHIRGKLEAFQATWISKLPSEKKPWAMTFDIGKDWSQESSINSLIEIPSENSHTAHCIRAWNGMVSILMQNEDDIAAAPFLPPHIQKIILKKNPKCNLQTNKRQTAGRLKPKLP